MHVSVHHTPYGALRWLSDHERLGLHLVLRRGFQSLSATSKVSGTTWRRFSVSDELRKWRLWLLGAILPTPVSQLIFHRRQHAIPKSMWFVPPDRYPVPFPSQLDVLARNLIHNCAWVYVPSIPVAVRTPPARALPAMFNWREDALRSRGPSRLYSDPDLEPGPRNGTHCGSQTRLLVRISAAVDRFFVMKPPIKMPRIGRWRRSLSEYAFDSSYNSPRTNVTASTCQIGRPRMRANTRKLCQNALLPSGSVN